MISLNDINKEIAILGTGLDAVRCVYKLYNEGISVKCFLNNNSNNDTFLGHPVYDFSSYKHMGEYVIIAVGTVETYLTLSKQLAELGLEEFNDYIFYKWIDRKVVLLHGNCHMLVVKSYLESSDNFMNQYAIYPNPLIQNNKEKKISDIVLKNCEVWIHEDIQRENKYGYFLSDVYIREKWLNERECKKNEIIIPHLFGLGKAFFPQSADNKRNEKIKNGQDANGMFPHADLIIDKCVEEGMAVNKIIAFCKGGLALDEKVVVANFEEYMGKIKEREKAWDIKIYDFILENYQKTKLFYDEGHPTNVIFEKICMDILKKLGVIEKKIKSDVILDDHENPVYPVVKHCLKLEWNEGKIRKSPFAKKMCDNMNFEEYIREYLWWSYGI